MRFCVLAAALGALLIITGLAYAGHGQLDLREADLASMDPMALRGPWAFYWDRLLDPRDLASETPEPDGYHALPQYWTRHGHGDYPSIGRATYVLRVLLPADADLVSLRVPRVYSSYVLYANGEWLGGRGRLAGEPTPYIRPQIYTLQRPPAQAQLDTDWELQLVLQISNEYHYFAGVSQELTLGSVAASHAQRLRALLLDGFILSLIAAAGAYHLIQYYFRRRRPEFLYFALMCLPAMLRRVLYDEVLLAEFFPGMPFIVGSRILSLTIPIFVLFFVAYLEATKVVSLPRWLVNAVRGFSILYAAAVLIMPVRLYAFWFQPYMVLLFLLIAVALPRFGAAFTNSLEARCIVLGGFFLFAGAASDALVYQQFIQGPFVMDFGLLVFLLLQTVLLGIRETRLQREVDELHKRLQVSLMEIRSTQSAFLSAQIKPHFLFNALNTISYLTYVDSDKAVDMISNLSHLLRQSFDFDKFPDTVPLKNELRTL